MYGIKAIILKELTRVFKDRKMIMSLFIMPVVLVVGIFSLMSFLIKSQTDDIESHTPVVYVQNAPQSFVNFINTLKLGADADGTGFYPEYTKLSAADESGFKEAKAGLLNGSADLVLSFEQGFEEAVLVGMEDLAGVKIPTVDVYFNPSEDYSAEARQMYQSVLELYKASLLGERFGDYSAVVMFTTGENVIQDEDKAVGNLLGTMLPYFITMLIFAGAMGLGVDMIAGEKERGTMATMLLSPVKRQQIVLGKVFALAILAVMSAAVYIISMLVALPIMLDNIAGGETIAGLSINFTGVQIAQMIVLMIGVVLLYVSIICMVAVFAKNVKEASSYITPVYLIVLVAGMITMYSSAGGVLYKYMIPIYGSSMAFKDILTREITMPNFLATAVSTYVVAALLVAVMTKAFNSEKVMFNA